MLAYLSFVEGGLTVIGGLAPTLLGRVGSDLSLLSRGESFGSGWTALLPAARSQLDSRFEPAALHFLTVLESFGFHLRYLLKSGPSQASQLGMCCCCTKRSNSALSESGMSYSTPSLSRTIIAL